MLQSAFDLYRGEVLAELARTKESPGGPGELGALLTEQVREMRRISATITAMSRSCAARCATLQHDKQTREFGPMNTLVTDPGVDGYQRPHWVTVRFYFRYAGELRQAVRWNLDRHAFWAEGWGSYYMKAAKARGLLCVVFAVGVLLALNIRVPVMPTLRAISALFATNLALVPARS